MQVIGAVIGGLVALQLLVGLYASISESRQRRQTRVLSRRLIEEQIRAAAALRVHREQVRLNWNGYRKFVVQKKVTEADGICSLYLVPHDRKPLPLFEPGQFLTFRLQISGQDKSVIRCYSLSCSPNKLYYRITVKRALPPPGASRAPAGVVSNFLHDGVREGDILDVQAPRGHFTLNPTLKRPVVLIGGGVGVTPLLSMVGAVAESGSGREVWFFYGVRNREDQIQQDYLQSLAEHHANIRVFVCYSQPSESDRPGRDFHYGQRITISLLKSVLPSNNFEFCVCGPPSMLESLMAGLRQWDVPPEHINTEAFGPASGRTLHDVGAAPETTAPAAARMGGPATYTVTFSKSKRRLVWDGRHQSLLELARRSGIDIESGCEIGNCGTCLVAIRSGSIEHTADVGADCEEGACLACVAVPRSDLELDA